MSENGKKKILFVMEHLGIGGAEKSLVTLLSLLDYEKVDVDLFLFRREGEFLSFVPRQVNILPELKEYGLYKDEHIDTLKSLILNKKLKSAFKYGVYLVQLIYNYRIKRQEHIGWKNTRDIYPDIDKKYDVAIGFLEKKTIYYTVDKVIADKKIGYIHNDYEKIPHDKEEDAKYFNKLNAIVTVSEHCAEVLKNNFKREAHKVVYINNFISPDIIKKMALEEYIDDTEENSIRVVTVGRLVAQKGIDNAIMVCAELAKVYSNIRWYVIGEGSERSKLEALIKEYGVENNLILVGAQSNPYKYMKMADIYVQPSRYEGYGITVAEAKILGKTIVANDIPEFREQLEHLKTGILTKDNKEMKNAIERLIKDKNLSNIIKKNLKESKDDFNDKNLKQFYKIIDERGR